MRGRLRESLDERSDHFGILRIDDGGQRLLGAYLAWWAMCHIHNSYPTVPFENPLITNVVTSLLNIPTIVNANADNTHEDILEARISSIVLQNKNSKVSAVSSFAWASILRSMLRNDSPASTEMSLDKAFDLYRNHPDVVAYSTNMSDFSKIEQDGVLGA